MASSGGRERYTTPRTARFAGKMGGKRLAALAAGNSTSCCTCAQARQTQHDRLKNKNSKSIRTRILIVESEQDEEAKCSCSGRVPAVQGFQVEVSKNVHPHSTCAGVFRGQRAEMCRKQRLSGGLRSSEAAGAFRRATW